MNKLKVNLGKLGMAVLLTGLTAAELNRAQEVLLWNPPMPRVKKDKKYIACIGDSITFGAGVPLHQKTQSYPAYLQKEVDDSYQVINYGLSGRTQVSNGDMPYIREKQYLESFHHKMDMVIWMLGTNDSKPYNWDAERYRNDMKSFLKKYYHANPEGQIVMMAPPKSFKVKGNAVVAYDILDENIIIANQIVKEVAAELQEEGIPVTLIDMYAFTEHHAEWFPDGVHPNAIGNAAIAKHIGEIIRPLLK